jgi:hypothetical protein
VPVKIVKVQDRHCDAGRRAERCFRFFHQSCSARQKALLLSLGALAFFGMGLTIARASSCSSCANSYTQRIAAAQGYGSWVATTRQLQALKGRIAQAGPGGGGGSIRPVPLSEIQKEATISAARGVTLDFSDGGASNVTVQTSDNPSVVQITSKTNAVTVAPGTAHLKVANFGRCPKPVGMEVVSCDPIPVFSVTINVQKQP